MRKRILTAMFLLFPVWTSGIFAQEILPDNQIQSYSCAASGYQVLFEKMERLIGGQNEHVNIIYLGDSHVQGGILTTRLRENFVRIRPWGDGGFGLVFPFVAAGTHDPIGYRTSASGSWTGTRNIQFNPDKDMGLQGMAATASLSGGQEPSFTISLGASGGPKFQADIVEVYGYGTDPSSHPVAVTDRGIIEPFSCQDSLYVIDLQQLTSQVTIRIRGDAGTFTVTGVRFNKGRQGFTLSGCGVNGASLDSWLRCKDFGRDLDREHPDLVILAVGTNDAYNNPNFDPELFKRKYRRIADRILESNPYCALLFVSNSDSACRGVPNPNGPVVEKAMSELAEEYNAGFWDLFALMGGMGAMDNWISQGLAQRDHVHFSWSGYQKIADMMYAALMDMYKDYKTRLR